METVNNTLQQITSLLSAEKTFTQFLSWFQKRRTTQGILVQVWITGYFMILIATVIWKTKKLSGESLFGEATCPECGQIYTRPFFAFNLMSKRYERCSHCKKWHLVSISGKSL